MIRKTIPLVVALTVAMILAARPIRTQSPRSVVLYEGARLIPGNGSPAIETASMRVEDGVITRIAVGRTVPGARRQSSRQHNQHAANPGDLCEECPRRPRSTTAVIDENVAELNCSR